MKFIMQQQVNIMKDTYIVTDEGGNLVSQINSKVISLHRKRYIRDASGALLYIIKGKLVDLLPTYYILDANEREIGKAKKKFSLRAHFNLNMHGKKYFVRGTMFHRSFIISDERGEIGNIRKDGFRLMKDKYEINVANRNDVYIMIIMTAIADMLYFNGKRSHD